MVIQDHLDADRGLYMQKLNDNEMKSIKAGNVTGTLLNAVLRGANIFLDVGKYFGSSIRRLTSKNLCGF